jgi:hypothetical protein
MLQVAGYFIGKLRSSTNRSERVPYRSLFRKPINLCAMAGILLYLPASASTLANTFLPGQTYLNQGGVPGLFGGSLDIHFEAAFTPSGDYVLTQIDVAITEDFQIHQPPAGTTTRVNLTLNKDSGGIPGAVLESWANLVPAPAPPASAEVTVFSTSTVQLSPGVQYWIVASVVPEPNEVTQVDVAFDVLGDPIPEPGACCLLGAGLFGLSLLKLAARCP